MSSTAPAATFDLDGALARLKGRGPALVLMHDNPDPDCMAAAECLRRLLETRAGLTVSVARGGIIGRPENRALVSVLGLEHVRSDQLDLAQFDVIAMVDTQPETGNNSLPLAHRIDIVVDHHPLTAAATRAPWCDVREGIGATSTITYGYLCAAGVPLDARLATALLYAIKSETRDLGRESSAYERAAYSELLAIADLEQLHRIAEPKVSSAHFAALDRAIRRAELRGNLLTVNLGALDYPDLVAEIADLLLRHDRARWVMCVGQHRGTVFLSIRTDDKEGRAGEFIKRIVAGKGSAGGHGQIAGGRLTAPTADARDLGRSYRQLVARAALELELEYAHVEPLVPRPEP
ncbi:MAG: phosphoesterase [Myxococcales bacterium]|nr:phosphoesterase [Myxococcales bacterium]